MGESALCVHTEAVYEYFLTCCELNELHNFEEEYHSNIAINNQRPAKQMNKKARAWLMMGSAFPIIINRAGSRMWESGLIHYSYSSVISHRHLL